MRAYGHPRRGACLPAANGTFMQASSVAAKLGDCAVIGSTEIVGQARVNNGLR